MIKKGYNALMTFQSDGAHRLLIEFYFCIMYLEDLKAEIMAHTVLVVERLGASGLMDDALFVCINGAILIALMQLIKG